MTADKCNAWLLPIKDDVYLSTGEFELVHVIMDWLRLYPIPYAPEYCKNVFVWQGQLIPLFDMGTYIRLHSDSPQDEIKKAGYISIVAYQYGKEGKDIKYGGLLLNAMPFRITVTDEQACHFPEDNVDWHNIALSCFKDPAFGIVPILNLEKIFSTKPAALERAA